MLVYAQICWIFSKGKYFFSFLFTLFFPASLKGNKKSTQCKKNNHLRKNLQVTCHFIATDAISAEIIYLLNCIQNRSHRIIRLEKTLKIIESTVKLTLPSLPLNHVLKCHIYTVSKYLQGWWLHHFPGQPVPMLDHPLSEEIFPNIQPKPPLTQLEAIFSCPITCYLGKERNMYLLSPRKKLIKCHVALFQWALQLEILCLCFKLCQNKFTILKYHVNGICG